MSLSDPTASTVPGNQPDRKKAVSITSEPKPVKTQETEVNPSAAKPSVPVVAIDVPHGPEIDLDLLDPTGPAVDASIASTSQKTQKEKPSNTSRPVVKKAEPVSTPDKQPPVAFEDQPEQVKSDKHKSTIAGTGQSQARPSQDKSVNKGNYNYPPLVTLPPPENNIPPVTADLISQKANDKTEAAKKDKKIKKQSTGTTDRKKAEPSVDSTVKNDDKKKSDQKPPTSRFRRSPTSPGKIKGTLVAEFPKRLVIKYRTGNNRDPFETLINDSKKYNNPVEKRVPNVEGLHLVGVIEAEGGANSALFEDKSGYGYILSEGDKVQNGYVLRVEYDRVYFQIFEYGWSRTFALNIDED